MKHLKDLYEQCLRDYDDVVRENEFCRDVISRMYHYSKFLLTYDEGTSEHKIGLCLFNIMGDIYENKSQYEED